MRTARYAFFVGIVAATIFLGYLDIFARQASNSPRPYPTTAVSGSSQPGARVLITITTKRGGHVSTPTKSDLAVRDDRHPVEVNELRSVKDEPLVFSLLVDGSASLRTISASQTAGAIQLFKALSNRGNHGYLILFKEQDGIDMNDRVVDAPAVEQVLEANRARRGPTMLYDAIGHAVREQLAVAGASSPPRRAIFVFTDGSDNYSHNSLEETLALLQREGIPVFAISTPPKEQDQMGSTEKKKSLENLRDLSRNTGGGLVALDDQGNFVSEILNDLDNQYMLSFAPFSAGGYGPHSLQVKSASNGFSVSAPAYYVAP